MYYKDTAVQAVQNANGKSIEAARETITRLLSKKMQQESEQILPTHLQVPNYPYTQGEIIFSVRRFR